MPSLHSRLESASSQRASSSSSGSAPVARGVLKRLSVGSGGGAEAGGAAAATADAAAATASSPSSEAKQVMFSDGIRPGGDLTELDGSDERTGGSSVTSSSSRRHHRRGRRHHHHHHHHYSTRSTSSVGVSLIPAEEGALPPLAAEEGKAEAEEEGKEASPSHVALSDALLKEGKRLGFQINKNLVVHVKLIKCE